MFIFSVRGGTIIFYKLAPYHIGQTQSGIHNPDPTPHHNNYHFYFFASKSANLAPLKCLNSKSFGEAQSNLI